MTQGIVTKFTVKFYKQTDIWVRFASFEEIMLSL